MSFRLAAPTRLSAISLVVGLAACAPSQDPLSQEQSQQGDDSIVDIAHTGVKDQSIGNCWVYATTGWVESLHLSQSGAEVNFSESYVSYWHWLEGIAGPAQGLPRIAYLDGNQLSTGGWFGTAAELMRRYGVIEEGDFIPEEAESALSSRQSAALAAINQSLASGALSTPEARADRALVRDELDRAWGLSPAVVAALDATFGAGAELTLATGGAPASDDIIAPANVAVGFAEVGAGQYQALSLADAIGQPASWDPGTRVGPYAWNEQAYSPLGADRRQRLREAQIALHRRLPVIMTWFVDFNAMGNDGAFRAPPEAPGHQGGHMTVLEDYEIDDVPGYGTLEAGTLVTDPAALEAALADEANIAFFRIKNSWGTDLAPPEGALQFAGYHDLYMEYLDGSLAYCTGTGANKCETTTPVNGMWGLVLPPAGFSVGTIPEPPPLECHAPCVQGASLQPACSPCVASVCAADPFCCSETGSWDQYCVAAVPNLCGADACTEPEEEEQDPACHDVCSIGASMTASCGACEASICQADPFCCSASGSWDALCVQKVPTLCGQSCN